jgi:chitin synthase
LNPLVATQNFEYKMSNILDKPLESAFGFISVLPGAFSAYRYVALQNDKTGNGPLEKYFLGEKMHGTNAGIFTANMYLAEDRILCFELVSKRNCHWILQYVKSATGETDVPVEMADFILQRRRWLNGSFFAAVYALAHSHDIFRSDHSFVRKMMFLVEFLYQTISMIFAWFQIGNFFLVFRILTASLATEIGTAGPYLFIAFEWMYIGVLITCFILALGNRPQGSNKWYMSMVYFWCIIMTYLMFASIFITVKSVQSQIKTNDGFSVADIFKDQIFFTLVVSLASTYIMWFIVSFIFLDPWHMFTCFIQYLLMTPTYINILNVYAFCNTHDITWGTKGDTKAEKLPSVNTKADGKAEIHAPTDDADLNTQYEAEIQVFSSKYVEPVKNVSASDKQEDYYKGFRSGVVLFWMFCNLALVAAVLQSGGLEVTVKTAEEAEAKEDKAAQIYLAVVLWSVAGLSLFRFIGAMWFLVVRMVSTPSVFNFDESELTIISSAGCNLPSCARLCASTGVWRPDLFRVGPFVLYRAASSPGLLVMFQPVMLVLFGHARVCGYSTYTCCGLLDEVYDLIPLSYALRHASVHTSIGYLFTSTLLRLDVSLSHCCALSRL